MKEIIDLLIAIVISSTFLLGGSYTLKEIHNFVRYEALKKTSQPLSSSEEMAQKLTDMKLDF